MIKIIGVIACVLVTLTSATNSSEYGDLPQVWIPCIISYIE